MYLFISGIVLIATIIGLFWLKDELKSPLLARLAYSGPIARLAVLGAVFTLLGLLLMISSFLDN